MRKLDIKSFLIGVLVTTNMFFFMGFSSNEQSDDCDDLMYRINSQYEETTKKLKNIQSKIDRTYSEIVGGVYSYNCGE